MSAMRFPNWWGALVTLALKRAGCLLRPSTKPHAVLLLDEIEKAHSDIFNILLQMMDYGKLTDSSGCKAHCSNLIIIMTSNVGQVAAQKEHGFVGDANTEVDVMQEVSSFS